MAFEKIPKYLDSPIQFLIFDPDDVIPMVVIYFLFAIFKQAAIGLVVGLIFTRIYQKLKNIYGPGFVGHLLYKWGLYNPPGLPDYIVREFYE